VANIQSSWVTQGREIGQLALLFGANDMGSLMLEENVVSAAGTVHHLTLEQMRSAISELGWIPRRRNVFYELFEDDDAVTPVDPSRKKAQSVHIPVAATTP
jgi:cyclic dehypoxanthinyl futalosine synthase